MLYIQDGNWLAKLRKIEMEKPKKITIDEDKKLLKKLQKAYKVCHTCGGAYGRYHDGVSSTWNGRCDVCDQDTRVTEARDYGYLSKGVQLLTAKLKQKKKTETKKKEYPHKGLKYKIGTPVGKKKVSATLHLPNKTGVVVDHGERLNAAGNIERFYLVKTDRSNVIEQWSPGITYSLEDKHFHNYIAFT